MKRPTFTWFYGRRHPDSACATDQDPLLSNLLLPPMGIDPACKFDALTTWLTRPSRGDRRVLRPRTTGPGRNIKEILYKGLGVEVSSRQLQTVLPKTVYTHFFSTTFFYCSSGCDMSSSCYICLLQSYVYTSNLCLM